jgi:hypothetical protein
MERVPIVLRCSSYAVPHEVRRFRELPKFIVGHPVPQLNAGFRHLRDLHRPAHLRLFLGPGLGAQQRQSLSGLFPIVLLHPDGLFLRRRGDGLAPQLLQWGPLQPGKFLAA